MNRINTLSMIRAHRGTRLLGRHVGTFIIKGRHNRLNGDCSLTFSSGQGMLVGTLGGTRDSSRCIMHICRTTNGRTRGTSVIFTSGLITTMRTSNARGAVNGTAFDKGHLRISIGPGDVGACGMHFTSGGGIRAITRPLPLICSGGYFD